MLARLRLPAQAMAISGLAVLLLLLGGAAVAIACDDCITVIDVPAWDEQITVTDVPAWDEPITVNNPAWIEDTTLDHPAVWVPPVPPQYIAHHDQISPFIPAHDDPYQVWVVSHIVDYQWVDTSHYVPVWVDTSWDEYYQYWQTVWCWSWYIEDYYDCGYWASGYYHHTSGYWDQQWVTSGYEQQVTIDTSHYETRYNHYDAVPAVYNDWVETIPGIPGYWIPAWSEPLHIFHEATTQTIIVHHNAATHMTTVHHIAVGHLQRLGAGSTQSAQGAPPATGGSGSSGAIVTEPVRIPIVTTLSLVDRPAYTETRTVVDVPAYDEQITIVDAPATTTTITVVDSPAHTVQHHDLVTPATSTQVQVLVTPAHDETTSTWVPETTTRYNTTAGQVMPTYVPDQYGPIWAPQVCYWEYDDGYRYWTCDGGYYYTGVITPAHWENQWHQGHYVYVNPRECDDDPDASGHISCWYLGWQWQWQEGPFWETVDTSHYVYTTTHYDAVYRTDTVTTPAVYNDWTESIAAVTHQATVTVPAVTHTVTVHHDAVTHLETVAHASSTYIQTLAFDAIVAPSLDGTGSDDGFSDLLLLMGLTAAASAGRFSTSRDLLRKTLADWQATGRPTPATALFLATEPSLSDAEASALIDEIVNPDGADDGVDWALDLPELTAIGATETFRTAGDPGVPGSSDVPIIDLEWALEMARIPGMLETLPVAIQAAVARARNGYVPGGFLDVYFNGPLPYIPAEQVRGDVSARITNAMAAFHAALLDVPVLGGVVGGTEAALDGGAQFARAGLGFAFIDDPASRSRLAALATQIGAAANLDPNDWRVKTLAAERLWDERAAYLAPGVKGTIEALASPTLAASAGAGWSAGVLTQSALAAGVSASQAARLSGAVTRVVGGLGDPALIAQNELFGLASRGASTIVRSRFLGEQLGSARIDLGLTGGAGGPGKWGSVRERMSDRARSYQAEVTGADPGTAYIVNNVKFDGYVPATGTLLDAKGLGYAKLLRSLPDVIERQLVKIARRQTAAAGTTPIEWRVAEAEAGDRIRALLTEQGITGITVTYVPPAPQIP